MYVVKSLCIRLCLALSITLTALPSWAAEGTTAAGPIGGTDIRSALLAPPGFYGGMAGLYSSVHQVNDGSGTPVPGLDAVDLNAKIAGAFFLYVPDHAKVLGGFGRPLSGSRHRRAGMRAAYFADSVALRHRLRRSLFRGGLVTVLRPNSAVARPWRVSNHGRSCRQPRPRCGNSNRAI